MEWTPSNMAPWQSQQYSVLHTRTILPLSLSVSLCLSPLCPLTVGAVVTLMPPQTQIMFFFYFFYYHYSLELGEMFTAQLMAGLSKNADRLDKRSAGVDSFHDHCQSSCFLSALTDLTPRCTLNAPACSTLCLFNVDCVCVCVCVCNAQRWDMSQKLDVVWRV